MGLGMSFRSKGGPEDGFFEGTEKRIEIDFAFRCGAGASTPGQASGLLAVSSEAWLEVVALCQTTIIGSKATDAFKSYLLSESSLIVYPEKVIIKTCGRTVPLASVKRVLSLGTEVGLEPEWLCYSRKDFLAPKKQPKAHQSMDAEINLCRQVCGVGDAYVLGPITGEHWLLYNADFQNPDCSVRGDYTIDMMMYGLPEDVRKHFYTTHPEGSREGADAMTRDSGFGALVASIGGEVDDYTFYPCGYSCNAHANQSYLITHVTPEEDCSYASFETNFGSVMRERVFSTDIARQLGQLVGQVLQVFKPEKLTMTMFIDGGAVDAIGDAPFDAAVSSGLYRRTTRNVYHFEKDYLATVANFLRCT